MILKIDMSGAIPIYVQIRNEIVKGIGKGDVSAGENLPTVRQLASELGINTMTVSKAYQLLKSEGFIETDRRKGAVVKGTHELKGSLEGLYREKLEGELELLSAEAKLRGLDKQEFMDLCASAFAGMEVRHDVNVLDIRIDGSVRCGNILCGIRGQEKIRGRDAARRAYPSERCGQ